MGNIDINTIRKRGFDENSPEFRIEDYCRKMASTHTDGLLERYNKLESSRQGTFINSDLMKMVYPFYANSYENRQRFNLSITNSAAVLTNEAYRRAITQGDIKRCIFLVGPYGAGKSFFAQSLYESKQGREMLEDSIIYEGSITPPAFGEKIEYASMHGVTPTIIVLNPTLELSMRNIRERAKTTGRDVIRSEVIDKFSSIYTHLSDLVKMFDEISYIIYNKESNIPVDLSCGSKNLEDLNHGNKQEISEQYDLIKETLDLEKRKSEGR